MATSGALNMSCVVPSFLQSIFVCHWQNVDKININYLFILPCVFLACYRLYIIEQLHVRSPFGFILRSFAMNVIMG